MTSSTKLKRKHTHKFVIQYVSHPFLAKVEMYVICETCGHINNNPYYDKS